MVLWVLLILEFKMVSYIVLLIGIMINRSLVSDAGSCTCGGSQNPGELHVQEPG